MKKFRIIIVCLCFLLFSVILFSVCKYGVLDIDNNVYNFISKNIMNDTLSSILKVVTHLGGVAFTFSSLSFTDILLFLNLNYNDFEPTGRGARGYKQMLKCKHADITILYDGTPNMGTHCEITSKGFYFAMCSFFKPLLVSTPFNSTALDIPFDFTHITYFLGQLVQRAKNVSRLDLAIDDYTDDYFTLDSLLDLVQSGRCISKFKSFKYEFSKKIGSLDYTGKTIYFGSRQSNVFLRVYDKALEQKVSNNMKWVRWEFELKNDMAINSINSILKFKSLPTFVFSLLNTYLRFINLDNERRSSLV